MLQQFRVNVIKYLVSNTQLNVRAQTWIARLGYTHENTSACLISLVQRSVWNNTKCFCVQLSTIFERGFVCLKFPRFRLPVILQSISFIAVPSTAVWSFTDLASARTSGIIRKEIKKTNSNKMWRSMVHFWKNADRANRKFGEKNLSQYYFV